MGRYKIQVWNKTKVEVVVVVIIQETRESFRLDITWTQVLVCKREPAPFRMDGLSLIRIRNHLQVNRVMFSGSRDFANNL